MAKRRMRVDGGPLKRDAWLIDRYAQARPCPLCGRESSVYQASGTTTADLKSRHHPACTCPGCGATMRPVMRAVAGWFWHAQAVDKAKGLTPEPETCSIEPAPETGVIGKGELVWR